MTSTVAGSPRATDDRVVDVRRRSSRTRTARTASLTRIVTGGVIAVLFLVPMFWMVSGALKTSAEVTASPPILMPSSLHFENFSQAVTYIDFWTYARNSLLVTVVTVVGDHTDVQVLATRPNGVLVTENRSKGVMFTRLRLTIDTSTGAVVYKTADFHRPWTEGITPDAEIQAKIDDLNAQLQPILGTQIGQSSVAIPRADSCGATRSHSRCPRCCCSAPH